MILAQSKDIMAYGFINFRSHFVKISKALELRQYKNGLASVKRMFVLKLPPFSLTYTVREKERQFPN